MPRANGPEAALVEGLDARVVGHVSELVAHLRGERELAVATRADPAPCNDGELDFADVRGQLAAKRAIEVAAAGGHNLLLIGPPGAGKTMLAQRIPTILPPLDLDRALETTAIYSVAALLGDFALMRRPPFRAPHHTVSDAGLLGGGTPPRPGEVSLANNGVLFLDEVPEFRRSALEALRQPLEDRRIHIARARQTVIYPARVTLVGAMNPCPCGHYGDTARACVCGPSQVARYRSRLSGPLLDRIDMHVQVGTVSYAALAVDDGPDHASAAIAGRVAEARERQRRRLAGSGLAVNAEMRGRLMRRTCALSDDAERLLTMAVARLGLSARSVDRVLKVARTVADLGGSDRIERRHLGEAVGYRALDRAPVAVGSASGYAASNA